jgi:hypothetical protein
MAVGSVYALKVVGRLGYNDEFNNTFHYRVIDSGTAPDQAAELLDLGLGWSSNVDADYRACIASTHVVDRVQARTVTGPLAGVDVTIALGGTSSGDVLPQQVSAEILFKTALLGRRNSGFCKLPCPTESDLASGIWSGPYLVSLNAFAVSVAGFTSSLNAVEFAQVVWSKTYGLDNLVIDYRVISAPRTQRSRTIGFGR